jgi:hypothetical protein
MRGIQSHRSFFRNLEDLEPYRFFFLRVKKERSDGTRIIKVVKDAETALSDSCSWLPSTLD